MVHYLITGAAGMMGTHLYENLRDGGKDVLATYYHPTIDDRDQILQDLEKNHINLDLTSLAQTQKIISKYKPKVIFHLASQSRPDVSFDKVEYTLRTNIIGTCNLFEACRNLDYRPLIVNASSSAVYGDINWDVRPYENYPTRPISPYGTSKLAQEHLARNYYEMGIIDYVNVRIFNCTGPRKKNDLISDICRRVVFDAGKIAVGNLETMRSIVDVRDLVQGLILCENIKNTTINLGGTEVYKVSDIVKMIIGDRETYIDPNFLRPTDEKIIWGNINKAKQLLGWEPKIPLEKTISDTLDYWRQYK